MLFYQHVVCAVALEGRSAGALLSGLPAGGAAGLPAGGAGAAGGGGARGPRGSGAAGGLMLIVLMLM